MALSIRRRSSLACPHTGDAVKTIKTSLAAPAPFSLKATALSHGWHECAPMSWSEGGRCFQIIERHRDDVFRVSVTQGSTRKNHVILNVMVEGRAVEDETATDACDRLRRVLGLDYDLGEFYALCAEHPTLHVLPVIGAGRGLRSACMGENVIKAICGTNVNWAQAVKMINRIGQLGPALPDFRSLNAWPTPREILRAGEKYLLEVCRVGYRAESILAFCADVCDRRFDPAELDEMVSTNGVASEEILAKLRTIRGIGPTSANYLLSFLGRHDRLSIDTATVAHVARTHTKGKKPTNKQIEKIYARYGRWKNKVWWYEQWLSWSTARQLLAEAAVDGPSYDRLDGAMKRRRVGRAATSRAFDQS